MHNFVFVRAKSASARPMLIERLKRQLLRHLPFVPEYVSVETVGAKDLFVSALASTAWDIEYAYRRNDSVTLIDGLAFLDEVLVEAEAVAKLLQQGPEHTFQQLRGQYCALKASPDRIEAVVDCSGSRPLHYIDARDWLAISNRQSLLSPIFTDCGYRSIDLESAAWLLTHYNNVGTRSIYSGVRLLTPGTALIANGDQIDIKNLTSTIWKKMSEKRRLDPSDYDTATEDLLSSFRGVAQFSRRLRGNAGLSLTGGKDSRIGLALAISTGLARSLGFFTFGRPDDPECQLARTIANTVGVNHEAIGGDPRGALSKEACWRRLRYAAFRYDYCSGGIDGGTAISNQKNTDLDLSGSFADIFRRIWKHTRLTRYLSVDESVDGMMRDWPLPYDALQVMRPPVSEVQRAYFRRWTQEKVDQGYEVNDVQEMYYVDNRMTWWLGTINTAQFARYRLVPLSGLRMAQVGMCLSVDDRVRERLHFEVLKRLSPGLLSMPFLNDLWHEDIRRENPSLSLAHEPFKPEPIAPGEQLPAWYSWFVQNGLGEIRSYLLDSPYSGLFDLVDYKRLAGAISTRGASQLIQARQILSLILVQMALTRDSSEPRDDVRLSENTNLRTNIADFDLVRPDCSYMQRPPRVGAGAPWVGAKAVQVNIPAGVQRIRLDPSNRPGIIQLSNLRYRTENEMVRVPLRSATPNREVRLLSVSDNSLVIDCTGLDPQLIFPINVKRSVTLEVDVFYESGRLLQVFWDIGEGFNADSCVSVGL